MKLILNGQEKEFSQTPHLRGVIEQFCKNSQRVIAEVNGEIVKSQQWEQTILKDGDALELVSFVGGG